MNDDKPRFGASGEDPLDRAIDRAVRAMMHVDPRAGFRRRVMARLETPSRRPTLFPRLAFATAALAVLVLAVVVIRRDGPVTEVPPAVALGPQTPVTVAPPRPQGPPSQTASAPPNTGRRAPRRNGLIEMPRIANVFGPPTGRIVGATITDASASPLVGERAVASESPAEDAREIPEIAPLHIAPLDVKPLQIAPLWPPK
jgi:hypothetical protein